MTRRPVRRAIQEILHRFGYRLCATAESRPDAFVVQSGLIKVREPVIIDIGAHTGAVARTYRERFPLASIHCFEPFPESFQALSQNMAGDARTHCHRTAVSDEKGTALLNANLSSATNSLLATDERGAVFWGEGLLDTTSQIEVGTTTVDAFCLEAGIPQVDILKMDVQGAEFSVLVGAQDTLANQRVSLVYTELIVCPTYRGQHKLHEYLSLLDSHGYDLLDFFDPFRSHNQLIQADAVFLSSSFKKGIEKRLDGTA
jgi:FkbM family methyltransferase